MNRQIEKKSGYDLINRWFAKKQWEPFDYQKDTWDAFLNGKSGLLNAPTGSGKTYALWVPAVLELLQQIKNDKIPIGLRVIWITPLRALAKDLQKALQLFIDDIGLKLSVELRTGDTSVAARSQQLKSAPTCLITTP
jgi:ATP-dependent helicase Lhr and Lhr-like helicase